MENNTEGEAVEFHGDEEIIEVIELNDTEPCPGDVRAAVVELL